MPAPPMSRSLSTSSVSSESANSSATQISEYPSSAQSAETENEPPTTWTTRAQPKRTRKRFTHEQLMVLEEAYYNASHPDRVTREALANKIGVDLKAVTIWFQNKRQNKKQIEKRYAMGNATNRGAPTPRVMYPAYLGHPLQYTLSSSQPLRPKSRIPQRTASGYLSLDRIASRAELPTREPCTPKKLARHASHGDSLEEPDAVWDIMLSSPLKPEPEVKKPAEGGSPAAKDYLRFASSHKGKKRSRSNRTLEWACASARVAIDKTTPPSPTVSAHDLPQSVTEEDNISLLDSISEDETDVDTDVGEMHEAITPADSQIVSALSPSPPPLSLPKKSSPQAKVSTMRGLKNMHGYKDTELMDAALALCGLRG